MADTALRARPALTQRAVDAHPEIDRGTEASVTADRAVMLYAYGRNGILVSAVASILLVIMVYSPAQSHRLFAWLGCMLFVLTLRGTDLILFHPQRRSRGMNAPAEILRFSLGTLGAGIAWAAFSITFFPVISPAARTATAVVLASMAGGSATILAPSLRLAIAYGTMMLVPPSLIFFTLPGRETMFLGVLGLAMYLFMSLATRLTHGLIVNALRLSRANESLRAQAETQRRDTQCVNTQLEVVQAALRDANLSLEDRIAARTADLAHEVAERKRYAEALARFASTDPLTGLCNRTHFAERLACMLAEAESRGLGLAVLFLDLDSFKQVNDVRGHAVGDKVLQRAACLLSREVC